MWAPERRILLFGRAYRGLALVCAVLPTFPLYAHLLNMSTVEIRLLEKRKVLVVAQLDLTRAFGDSESYFAASQVARPLLDLQVSKQLELAANAIHLQAGDVRIPVNPTRIAFANLALADYRSPLEWPRAQVQFEGQLPSDLRPIHNAVSVRFDDSFVFEEPIATTLRSAPDDVSASRWLVTLQSSPSLSAPAWFAVDDLQSPQLVQATTFSALQRYFGLGFWHIIPNGVDHLLFLLAIVLGVRTARGLLLSLSTYTAAHTLSFAAATLGWLPASMMNVEPLILLSIVCSALLNLWSDVPSVRQVVITFAFGLLHGLGFASAISGAGLPTELRLESLLGFNLGVESAQLLCVVCALPVWWCRRFSWYPSRLRNPVSLLIALIALALLFRL